MVQVSEIFEKHSGLLFLRNAVSWCTINADTTESADHKTDSGERRTDENVNSVEDHLKGRLIED